MGIHGFHKWIDELKLRTYIRNRQKYNILAIDLNGILHTSIRKAKSNSSFFKAIKKEIDIILKVIVSNQVAFFIDGTAPFAKLRTQISRRRQRSFNGDTLDPIQITPGVENMIELSNFLRKTYPRVYLSDSSQPGEGEIKLINWLLKIKSTGKIAIYGGDADLVLIATAARPLFNISIVSKDKKGFNWINVDNLWKMLPGTREEITLVCMLLGNDYLPRIPGINYNNIWKMYSKRLFRNDKLCYKNWIEYFQKIDSRKLNPKENSDGNPNEYFKGLLWCLSMYSKGVCDDYSFVYKGKAPSLNSCIEFFQSDPKIIKPKNNMKPLTPEEAALILMPKWGVSFLPDKLKQAMQRPDLIHWYPDECHRCINFRKEVSQLNKLHAENKEYTAEIAELNNKYHQHKKDFHPEIPIPIKEIRTFLKEI